MSLLESLFPGLSDYRVYGIPNWEDYEHPWEILAGKNGIINQLISLVQSGDGIFIHESAKVDNSASIESPSYVGPEAVIRHGAFLRGGSWICGGALVGNSSEIKNSVLLPGAKAPHFNYVGDSIVGFNVNLGAGVKLSNVRNDRREVRVTLEDGSTKNSGLSKFGAIIGDGSQIGCNSVTNPGAILPRNSMVSPNTTVTGWYTD